MDIRDAAAINILFSKHRGKIEAHRAHRVATVTRLGCARSANRFYGQRQRHAESARSGAGTFSRRRHSFSHQRTKSMATRRIGCRCANWRNAGKSSRATNTSHGISETMSIDYTKHSLFGASKVAADILVQEYGRYFGMPTVSFPWRLPHRTGACRRGAAWFSCLPDDLLPSAAGRIGFSATKANRSATTFTASIWSKRLRNSFAPRAPAKSTTSAAAGIATVPCSKRSLCAKKSAATN